MRTLLFFRTGAGRFAVPVEATLGVRDASGLVDLPAPRGDVAGVLPGEPPISVVCPLGSGSSHVVLLSADGISYGLLVDQVTGLRRIDDAAIGPAPAGQEHALVTGVVHDDDELVWLADPRLLAGAL